MTTLKTISEELNKIDYFDLCVFDYYPTDNDMKYLSNPRLKSSFGKNIRIRPPQKIKIHKGKYENVIIKDSRCDIYLTNDDINRLIRFYNIHINDDMDVFTKLDILDELLKGSSITLNCIMLAFFRLY